MVEINTATITEYLTRHLLNRSIMAIPNYYIDNSECDIFSYDKEGIVTEYEIKVSHSDFLADFKKEIKIYDRCTRRRKVINKHLLLQEGTRVNRFVYVAPVGVINPKEVPSFAGLIEVHDMFGCGMYFRYKKRGKRLNEQPLLERYTNKLLFKLPFIIARKKYGFSEESKE